MVQPAEEGPIICPECGQELWYDDEAACWVCDTCGVEFSDEDWEIVDEEQ
jgi:ribosomal protein L37AE/L43A